MNETAYQSLLSFRRYMLRSLPAILSIVILVLGPRACCLSTMLKQRLNDEKAGSTKALTNEGCSCKKHGQHSSDSLPCNKNGCPCEKWHFENSAIIQSLQQVSVDLNIQLLFFQNVVLSYVQLMMFESNQSIVEPSGFPRLCASELLRFISVARC